MRMKDHPFLASLMAMASIGAGGLLAHEIGVDAATSLQAVFIMACLVAAVFVVATVVEQLRRSPNGDDG